jgi:hypothetical protein
MTVTKLILKVYVFTIVVIGGVLVVTLAPAAVRAVGSVAAIVAAGVTVAEYLGGKGSPKGKK